MLFISYDQVIFMKLLVIKSLPPGNWSISVINYLHEWTQKERRARENLITSWTANGIALGMKAWHVQVVPSCISFIDVVLRIYKNHAFRNLSKSVVFRRAKRSCIQSQHRGETKRVFWRIRFKYACGHLLIKISLGGLNPGINYYHFPIWRAFAALNQNSSKPFTLWC